MHKLSVQQMSGAALHKGTVTATQGFLTYRYRCPFHGSHNCNWLCRVSIPLVGDATNAVAQKTPAEQRQHHANHPCAVEVDSNFQHVAHAGPHSKGPHMLFVLEAQTTNEMWSWSSSQIQHWMQDKRIELAGQIIHRYHGMTEMIQGTFVQELADVINNVTGPLDKRISIYKADEMFAKYGETLVTHFQDTKTMWGVPTCESSPVPYPQAVQGRQGQGSLEEG